MLVVRGSAAFMKALRLVPAADPLPADTTALGDWHAHVLTIERSRKALFVNTMTLLAVVVDAAPKRSMMERFRAHLERLLRDIGVSQDDIERELVATKDVVFCRHTNRSVMGTINRMKLEIPYYLDARYRRGESDSQDVLEDRFADEIWRLIDHRRPTDIIGEHFSLSPAKGKIVPFPRRGR